MNNLGSSSKNWTGSGLGRRGRSLLFIVFFLSGTASLIFEVIWTRLLLISIGATAIAVGAVLAAFMGGMAIGSSLAGHRFFSRRNPVVTYALLEGWIGIYGLCTPFLLRSVAAISPVLQVLFVLIILLPATIAMGASLPVLSRALQKNPRWNAVAVGRLYAANTAGAVMGPLISVFLLFPVFGLNHTLYFAAGLDLLVFGWLIFRRKTFPRWESPESIESVQSSPKSDRPPYLLLIAMAVSGAIAMVYEVAWARTLSLVYGSSVYGISIMLSTFLLGIAGGSALASVILRRRGKSVSFSALAWLLTGSAVGAFLSLMVARYLPFLFLNLYRVFPDHNLTLFLTQFVVSVLLMLPATLCLGSMLPVAISFSSSNSKVEVGRQVSWLYTSNLVGSALGSVIAAGLLIGNLGIELSVRAASVVALSIALILVISTRGARFFMTGAATIVVAILFILGIDPRGEPVAKGYGFYSNPREYDQYNTTGMREVVDSHQLLYYRDGPTATVSVQRLDRYMLLMINGKTDASNGPSDIETQLLLGHLPLMVKEAKQVAIIGLGSGMTAGAVLSHNVDKVDVFEIEPAVVEASHFFDDQNGKPLIDPRLQLIVGDARSQLLKRKRLYDLIISEPSNPWISGVANLFTQDFFALAASRLKPGGILTQWFHLYGMSEDSVRTLIATFRSVFPHILLFKERDLILLGSNQPIRFNLQRMKRVFEIPQIKKSLSRTYIRYPFDLFVQLRLDEKGAEDFSKGARLNTDNNLILELAAPRSLYHDRINAIRTEMAKYSHTIVGHLTGYQSLDEVYIELAASYFTAAHKEEAIQMCRQALKLKDSFNGQKLLGQILQDMGQKKEAREAFQRALDLGGDPQDRKIVEALLRSLDSPADN